MCGISGILNFNQQEVDKNLITNINNMLSHRGPDSGDVAIIGNVALGHRRLSIIDLSESANQPMVANDNFTIVFNGEIYNFQEIREKLIANNITFNTNSDTEVVLKSFIVYGTDAFKLYNGMFALAIYNHSSKELVIARDQFGIKPLYYFLNKDVLVFASEMKSILSYPGLEFTLNKQALVEYFWFENALGDNTFYNEINEIKPGTFVKVNADDFKVETYFDINQIKEIEITEEKAAEKIKELFEASVKRHLISDVPVGVFLSGGVDSSAITAFASKHYQGKLKTFSVAFDFDKGVNELNLAKEVAEKYNTDHHEIKITGADLVEVLEELVIAHDEPFGDAADIPLYLLTKKLKGTIKVVLQGDGGDEFFGGYSRYLTITNSKKYARFSFVSKLISFLGTKNPKLLRIQRFLNAIGQKEPFKRNALLLTMESKYSNPLQVLNRDFYKEVDQLDQFKRFKEVYDYYPKDMDPTQAVFYTDVQTILKDTYFEKVDKSTMANSMEVRVPFIDKELTEFALSIPARIKTKQGEQKYLLKKAMDQIVPDKILYGKKKGFGVPYAYWLTTSLKDYFIEQISTKEAGAYLDKNKIIEMFEIHKKHEGNYGFILWKTLIFAIWVNNKSKIMNN
ncbi:asparagine synthase (glutamine-hydrolyzing) [Pedobacter sp. KBW01]|uniref:asparagine synthase (glutamine-hydrolyzing) n=1 Tax=Pedobacter sp. KBW01 TaxID=2153364 RepID=UPI000F5A13DE|nr:asparagine synthase (glutamine-hydrolyzing) [Pedobacter sp. KBW01]RQO65701.1 asparagine synthase (glutamine-hydrolyzing) [Pedobacter sp. KBW01]